MKKSLGHKASLKEQLVGHFSSGTLLFQQNIAGKLFYEAEEGEIILLATRVESPSGAPKASLGSPYNSVESPHRVQPHLSVTIYDKRRKIVHS